MDARRIFGNQGEDAAATFLENKGYAVTHRQYKNTYGEIDLICQDGKEIVFVEVKSRHSDLADPEDSVTQSKVGHLVRTAQEYLDQRGMGEVPWRIDVVAIEYDRGEPQMRHIEDIDIPERFW
ncbi:YraN family protein [Candidatus Uhrbacteria bacterium]|nr:YraN family protein [Candidatus Uhrbacteria bacterium]